MAPARLSDYLRLPVRRRAGISELPDAEASPPADPTSAAYLVDFADWASSVVARSLSHAQPDAICHVSFVRGSLSGDRLSQADAMWPRTAELLDLEGALDGMRDNVAASALSELVEKLLRELTASLLDIDGKAGPGKPLYRAAAPDDKLLVPENLADILAFVEEAGRLRESVSDPTVIALLHALAPKAKDVPLLAEQVERVFKGLGREDLLPSWLAQHESLLAMLVEQRCYCPLVPLTDASVEHTSNALDVSPADARVALNLARFAALILPFEKGKKVHSDAAVRSFSAMSWDGTDLPDELLAGQSTPASVLENHEAVLEFSQRFKRVKFTYRPSVFVVPSELAVVCAKLAPGQWVDIAACFRVSLERTQSEIESMTGVRVETSVLERIIFLSGPHIGDTGWKRLEPGTLDRDRLQSVLRTALDGTDESFETLFEACDEALRHPTSWNVRGLSIERSPVEST